FQCRDSLFHFFNAVGAKRDHSALAGEVSQLIERGAVADQVETSVVGDEQLVNADSSCVAEVSAARASARAEKLFDVAGELLDLPFLVETRLVFFLAVLAELSNQPLRQHPANGRAD